MLPVIEKVETLIAGWLTVRRVHLRHGTMRYDREVEHHGNGATVLPYDPDRRVALIIRQPRTPLLLAGETTPLIEAPAGLIDPGEEPEACVRREAFEEAGVRLTRLEPLGAIWTMPGVSTERMFMFLAPYGPADRTGPGGGLPQEHESIAIEEIPLADLARQTDANQLPDIRTLTLLLSLRVRHPELF